jgi:putative transposase
VGTWVLGWLFLLLGLAMPAGLKRFYGKGDLHFITFSCYRRLPLLKTTRARNLFVKELGRVRDATGFRLIGYVVMPEHVHLLISEPREGTPSTVLHKLKLGVARKLRKRKRDCAGQLRLPFAAPREQLRAFWQARFYDFNVYSRGKKPPRRLRELTPNPCRHQHRSAGILPATACSSKVAVEVP